MQLLLLLLGSWALCPVLCSVLQEEQAKGTRRETERKATVDASAGVSFSTGSKAKKAKHEPTGGTAKSVANAGSAAESADDEEEDEEAGDVNVIPENITCSFTAENHVLSIYYNQMPVSWSTLEASTQWSVPKTFSFTLVPYATLSIITSNTNPSSVCSTLAIQCSASGIAFNANSMMGTNNAAAWRSQKVFSSDGMPCMTNVSLLMSVTACGHCCGIGGFWNTPASLQCPGSDPVYSAFRLMGTAAGTTYAQMGSSSPYAAFIFPAGANVMPPVTTCDIYGIGGANITSLYYNGVSVMNQARTLNSLKSGPVKRINILQQANSYFVIGATGPSTSTGNACAATAAPAVAIYCSGLQFSSSSWYAYSSPSSFNQTSGILGASSSDTWRNPTCQSPYPVQAEGFASPAFVMWTPKGDTNALFRYPAFLVQ